MASEVSMFLGMRCSPAQNRDLPGIVNSEQALEAELVQVLTCEEGMSIGHRQAQSSPRDGVPGPGKEGAKPQLRGSRVFSLPLSGLVKLA